MWPRNASLFQYRKKFSRIEQRNLCGQSNYDTGQVLTKIQSKTIKGPFPVKFGRHISSYGSKHIGDVLVKVVTYT